VATRPYITAEISLLATSDGGRAVPTPPTGQFGCLMCFDDVCFDVRFDTTETGSMSPGQTLTATLRFLSPDLAIPRLSIGKQFSLREGRTIAVGRVIAIHAGT
jgi:GTPase